MPELSATTSDVLHNKNCFYYLQKLKLTDSLLDSLNLPPDIRARWNRIEPPAAYDPDFAYGGLYTEILTHIEDHIAEFEPSPELDRLIVSIYNNDNNILTETFESIKHLTAAQTPGSHSLEHAITASIKDKENINPQTPAEAGSAYGRFTAMMSSNFKPQLTTSLSTVRHYDWNDESSIKEYRFGTQGQRHEGKPRVSPLFEKFLEAERRKLEHEGGAPDQITHVYFNNLGRDRTDVPEGVKERALTQKLHDLEFSHPNVAVITLAADKGFMRKDEYKKVEKEHSYEKVFTDFYLIATEDPKAKIGIRDFHISKPVRERLFTVQGIYSEAFERQKIIELMQKSFKDLGFKEGDVLSSAQRQAVWFHFNKFVMPNYILETLNPKSMNFSCKDAIDRGGVSSAWYNLVKSFETDSPMSREEFDQALHAAPTMVKGRGMNHHAKLIWNAVDVYVNANLNELSANPEQAWLIRWRDNNCPHERVEFLLSQRVAQAREELDLYLKQHPEAHAAVENGKEILNAIKTQSDLGVSGKRLLLQVVDSTVDLVHHPKDEAKLKRHETLMNDLSINPHLNKIGGLLKMGLGGLLFATNFGKKTLDSGIATYRSGEQVDSRISLQQKLKDQMSKLRDSARQADAEKKVENQEEEPTINLSKSG